MNYKYLLLFLLITNLKAEFIDSDLDGVEDSKDKCPNTPLFVLVNKDGCGVKNLKEDNVTYSLSLGYFYSKDTTSYSSTYLNFSFSYKNFSGFIENSKYSSTTSGLDDTTIALYYTLNKKLIYTIGVGAYLPTNSDIKNNKTDPFISLKIAYIYKNFDTYILYQKTFMQDSNSYNSNLYTFNIGYNFTKKLYTSISYQQSDSIYQKEQTSKSINLFLSYYIKDNIFINTSYSKGLNSYTNNSFSFAIGYDF